MSYWVRRLSYQPSSIRPTTTSGVGLRCSEVLEPANTMERQLSVAPLVVERSHTSVLVRFARSRPDTGYEEKLVSLAH